MKIFNRKEKGFTLIELLVVIAIIAILASIVLVSLTAARGRARDARVIAALAQVRPIAEIIYSSDNEYDNICTDSTTLGTDENLDVIAADIIANQDGSGEISCYAVGDDYCVAAALRGDNQSFCISSDGMARTTSSSTANSCASATTSCGS